MKTRFFILVFLLSCFNLAKAQNLDTALVIKKIDSLINLSLMLTKNGELDKALENNLFAEKVTVEKLGKESSLFGAICFGRGLILESNGELSEAMAWYDIAKKNMEKNLMVLHGDYANVLNHVGSIHCQFGRYEEAVQCYLETEKIYKIIYGEYDRNYTRSLVNLSMAYSSMGQFEKSEPLLFKIINIFEEHLKDKSDLIYLTALKDLGALYAKQGDYSKGEQLIKKAINTYSINYNKNSVYFASFLASLAEIYYLMGNFKTSGQLYSDSKDIIEKIYGKESLYYGLSLSNIALSYMEDKKYIDAEKCYLESVDIFKITEGVDQIDYALLLNNLARLYAETRNYNKAQQYLLESKEIIERKIGKNNVYFAEILKNIGGIEYDNENFDAARYQLLEASEILLEIYGEKHPFYAEISYNIARLYQKMNNISEASVFYLKTTDLNRQLIEKMASYASENQMIKYLYLFKKEMFEFYSFAQLHQNQDVLIATYNNLLFSSGYLLENVCQLNQIEIKADSLTKDIVAQWRRCHRRLADEYSKSIDEQQSVADIEVQANEYEKSLRLILSGFNDLKKTPKWNDIVESLNDNEVAIEFFAFPYSNPDPTDSILYAALVLRPGWPAPRWVSLFEQRQLDALLPSNPSTAPDNLNRLYTANNSGVIPEDYETLYQLVWAPLDSLLEGVKTIYYAPSGLLHRLNLGAMATDATHTLADRYTLHRVNSTRELVVPTRITPGENDALVYGGIQYAMDSTAIRAGLGRKDSVLAELPLEALPFYPPEQQGTRGGSWDYLPGTKKEAASVGKMLAGKGFRTVLREGYDASEESFKKIGRDGRPSPRVLHIATHGFFYPDPKDTLQKESWSLDREPAFKVSEHPMIRSGLVLAGGNAAWKNQPHPADLEDGILTAYEISQMNLRNTELVVLSACETGLGDIEGNEGVYGLQRAFKIAGAKYLLMSLWKVPDTPTQQLMERFYQEWTQGKNIPDAFQAAQSAMRKKYPQNPYWWAGFVLVE